MVRIDALPRTVELRRAPDGSARFRYVDQRLLPAELAFCETGSWRAVVDAIKELAVRGAPAIGAAGAAAVALWACNEGAAQANRAGCAEAACSFKRDLEAVAAEVAQARPTAVNLAWGAWRVASRMLDMLPADGEPCDAALGNDPYAAAEAAFAAVKEIEAADEAANRAIGAHGAALLPQGARVLTHCNAGSLATVFYGTALGVVYAAAEQGRIARVYADETRPVGQGARLTAWELSRAGVPTTLICDNMAASLMAQGCVDAVIVGADRIAANGDVANKIGTYGVAVLAKHHGIPFYVAAPESTFDAAAASGACIPIEERAASEVAAPIPGVSIWNPAFDVTPAALITRIVTERGAFPPEEAARAAAGNATPDAMPATGMMGGQRASR